jgi:hypothetical protein
MLRNILRALLIGGVTILLGMAVTDITPLHHEDWQWRYGLRLAIGIVGAIAQLRFSPTAKGLERWLFTIMVAVTIGVSIGHFLDLIEGPVQVSEIITPATDGNPPMGEADLELVNTGRRLE